MRVPSHWNENHRGIFSFFFFFIDKKCRRFFVYKLTCYAETPFLHETEFMHPTRLHFDDTSSKTHVEWHSRRHRKGRNFIIRNAETKERLGAEEYAQNIFNLTFF